MSCCTHAIVPRFSALLLVAFVSLGTLQAQSNYATPYTFTTFAGNVANGFADGTGSAARFYAPHGVAVDTAGNTYVADTNNHVIRKITAEGVVTTLAGSAGISGSTDGMGGDAQFNYPGGVAVDGANNVYVADTSNHTIRKITPYGDVTTFVGSAGINGSTDGAGSAARFYQPGSVVIDGAGNGYVADTFNHTVRKITPAGVVTTLAGAAGISGSVDGVGSAAQFGGLTGVTVDAAGNVYVAGGSTIRKITSTGVVTTLAGIANTSGSTDGPGTAARFSDTCSVADDSAGNVYAADFWNSTIRKITAAGVVTTFAGTAGSRGSIDGVGSDVRFNFPNGVAIDSAGNIYVTEASNTIRKITPAGLVTTLAGAGGGRGSTDGTGNVARFDYPKSVAVDSTGNVFVADLVNATIRKISAIGMVTTFAGAAHNYGRSDGVGSTAQFSNPSGVAVDIAGNVYVADNNTIRKITAAGVVFTLAGTAGIAGWVDGAGSAARFYLPSQLAVDGAGNVYVADAFNQMIRKVTPTGVVTTLAGSPLNIGSADGTGSAAQFNYPSGVAVDSTGNVYVADELNGTIRKITAAGSVTTLAGSVGFYDSNDGTGSTAHFRSPRGVAVDGVGNVYVSEFFNHTIRKITAAGVVTTLAGTAGSSGSTDGTGSIARFDGPSGVAVDSAGNLYVADSRNDTIRKGWLQAAASPVFTMQPANQSVAIGNFATFTVIASGYPAPTYQWQKNGVTISGATGSSYTITSVVEGDAGSYTAVVANTVGSVTSNAGVLTTVIVTPSNAVITITVE